jgi:hypothetical protein
MLIGSLDFHSAQTDNNEASSAKAGAAEMDASKAHEIEAKITFFILDPYIKKLEWLGLLLPI